MLSCLSSRKTNKVDILVCPDNYDPQKFTQICTLFDKLDQDSNLGIGSDELRDIARLHVKNCKIQLQQRLLSNTKILNQELLEKKQQYEHDCRVSKEAMALHQEQITQKMNWYVSLDETDSAAEFLRVVSKGQDQIDFQTFFEYMKSRTADIRNIKSIKA